jgi:hypothetical protein
VVSSEAPKRLGGLLFDSTYQGWLRPPAAYAHIPPAQFHDTTQGSFLPQSESDSYMSGMMAGSKVAVFDTIIQLRGLRPVFPLISGALCRDLLGSKSNCLLFCAWNGYPTHLLSPLKWLCPET